MKSLCVESAEPASYLCQGRSLRFGEFEKFRGLAYRHTIQMAPGRKQGVDLHPRLLAQSPRQDSGRAFPCAVSRFPPQANQLQFKHTARGTGSVRTELLQLGSKATQVTVSELGRR